MIRRSPVEASAVPLINYLMRVCIGTRHHGERNCSSTEQNTSEFVVPLSESEVERSVSIVAALVHCYAWIRQKKLSGKAVTCPDSEVQKSEAALSLLQEVDFENPLFVTN